MRDQAGSLMFRVGYERVDEPLKNLRKLYEIQELPDLEQRLAADRQGIIDNYAYLIMHNMGMSMTEKKRLILGLDFQQGKALFRKNLVLWLKERIAKCCCRRNG
jgi:hypothetical protein